MKNQSFYAIRKRGTKHLFYVADDKRDPNSTSWSSDCHEFEIYNTQVIAQCIADECSIPEDGGLGEVVELRVIEPGKDLIFVGYSIFLGKAPCPTGIWSLSNDAWQCTLNHPACFHKSIDELKKNGYRSRKVFITGE